MFNKDNLHHAYLLEGKKELIFPKLLDFLKQELSFETETNPDFYLREMDTFGVGDSQELKDFQNKKALVSSKQILVVQTSFITHEAQNSLLKVFEEPSQDTHIFLIVPSAENFLATLKSRFQIIKIKEDESGEKELVGEFLKSNIAQRFILIKKFLPKKLKEKADKVGAINFLNELEKELYLDFKKRDKVLVSDKEYTDIFKQIGQCRSYLNDRSPSVKMLLEHTALITPQIKN